MNDYQDDNWLGDEDQLDEILTAAELKAEREYDWPIGPDQCEVV